jgi:ADP-heptose:LPS heptosyltransferase
MSLPALYSLRIFYEKIPWTMAGNLDTLSLLHYRFYARGIVSIHQKEWAWLFQEENAIPGQFQTYLSSFQKAFLLSAHQPEMLIRGLSRAGLENVVWIPSLPDIKQGTALRARQKEILESENIPWIESDKYIFPSQEDLVEARNYLSQHLKIKEDHPLWAIHPGSGSPHKNWPLQRFLETARNLRDRNQFQPIFLVGPVEKETDSVSISAIQNQGFPIVRDLSLPVLAGLLSYCHGYLGNDSGISHLAAAIGIPTVVLFGPTNPVYWSPQGPAIRIISTFCSCAPCDRETMRLCSSKECLISLNVQQVLEAI